MSVSRMWRRSGRLSIKESASDPACRLMSASGIADWFLSKQSPAEIWLARRPRSSWHSIVMTERITDGPRSESVRNPGNMRREASSTIRRTAELESSGSPSPERVGHTWRMSSMLQRRPITSSISNRLSGSFSMISFLSVRCLQSYDFWIGYKNNYLTFLRGRAGVCFQCPCVLAYE